MLNVLYSATKKSEPDSASIRLGLRPLEAAHAHFVKRTKKLQSIVNSSVDFLL